MINDKDCFDFSVHSVYTTNFFTYFKGNKHLSNEITNGHCLYLVYSLCWQDEDGNCVINQGDLAEKLANCLTDLSKHKIGILLDEEYTDISIEKNGSNALKNKDKDRFDLVYNALNKLPTGNKPKLIIVKAELELEYFCYDSFYESEASFDESFYDLAESDYEWKDEYKENKITICHEISGKKFNLNKQDLSTFFKIINPNDRTNEPFADLNKQIMWNRTRHTKVELPIEDEKGGTKRLYYRKHILAIWPKI